MQEGRGVSPMHPRETHRGYSGCKRETAWTHRRRRRGDVDRRRPRPPPPSTRRLTHTWAWAAIPTPLWSIPSYLPTAPHTEIWLRACCRPGRVRSGSAPTRYPDSKIMDKMFQIERGRMIESKTLTLAPSSGSSPRCRPHGMERVGSLSCRR